MTRTEQSRVVLSDWRFWMIVAYIGIAATVVGLVVLFNRTAREEAFRAAGSKSAATTQVGQCFASVKNGPVVRGFIAANEAVIANSITATEAALDAQPTSPLTVVRLQSLDRLRNAKENADELQRLIEKSIPTRASCISLAARLHIDVSRYLKGSP